MAGDAGHLYVVAGHTKVVNKEKIAEQELTEQQFTKRQDAQIAFHAPSAASLHSSGLSATEPSISTSTNTMSHPGYNIA